ncbi:MAG: hypothetical protein PHO53_03295 [Actinomycetota bacterium]|nr:hypothetical protein [Actinomycetota bacterium]
MRKRRTAAKLILIVLLASLFFLEQSGMAIASAVISLPEEAWTRIASGGLGDPHTIFIAPAAEFKEKLYFISATKPSSSPAPIWVLEGESFKRAPVPDGFGDPNNFEVYPTVSYKGSLYCGTKNTKGAGQLWKTADGSNWEQVTAKALDNSRYSRCLPLGVQNEKLLIALSGASETEGKFLLSRVISYDEEKFSSASDSGFGTDIHAREISGGCSFEGRVYAIASQRGKDSWGEELPLIPLVWEGGKIWKQVAEPGFGNPANVQAFSMLTDEKRICVGTMNFRSGSEVWSYDGDVWTKVAEGGMGNSANSIASAFPWGDSTVISTSGFNAGESMPEGPAKLFMANSFGEISPFAMDGFGEDENDWIAVSALYRGDFLAGTLNKAKGAQVWKASAPPYDTCYFAEGTTRDNQNDGRFEEWVSVLNPNKTTIELAVTFIAQGEPAPLEKKYLVSPISRLSINVKDEIGKERDVSLAIRGTRPFVAERAVYFDYRSKWRGGHVVEGTPSLEKRWYFAEGTTRDNPKDGTFETWLCILNPSGCPANAKITYMLSDGMEKEAQFVVAPYGRYTRDVNLDLGKDKDFSILVETDVGVVAERSTYFSYRGVLDGGTAAVGTANPSKTHYFAEGSTYPWNQQWITILNPGEKIAQVEVAFQPREAEEKPAVFFVKPKSRYTVEVARYCAPMRDVSAKVSSDIPIVCERAMYLDYQGKCPGGSVSKGLQSPKRRFYFAGSSPGGSPPAWLDEWVCIQNPSADEVADVEMTFVVAEGLLTRYLEVPPGERVTVSVGEIIGANGGASLIIESGTEVAAERSSYFLRQDGFQGVSFSSGMSF